MPLTKMNLRRLREELAALRPTRANPNTSIQVIGLLTKAVYALLRYPGAVWIRLHTHDGRLGRSGEIGGIPLNLSRAGQKIDSIAATDIDDLVFSLRIYADQRGQDAAQTVIDFFVDVLAHARRGGRGPVEAMVKKGKAESSTLRVKF